jgi:hypothetical protein
MMFLNWECPAMDLSSKGGLARPYILGPEQNQKPDE